MDKLEQVQTWWQNSGLETQTLLKQGIVVLVALLGGHIIALIVARALRSRNFDSAIRLPSATSHSIDADHRFTPTFVAGMLVRLSIWAGAAAWLAREHGRPELAETLRLIVSRTWGVATLLVAALALGSLLARRLTDCLRSVPGASTAAGSSRNGTSPSRFDAVGAVAAAVYVVVLLLALMIAADIFDWPLTRTSAQALWQLVEHLLVAAAALFVGLLGARWMRDLVSSEAAGSPEKRVGHYSALAVMGATSIMAVTVILSGAGMLVGLVILAVLGVLLWLARGYLPDVAAYLQLRSGQVRQVRFDGVPWQVAELGLLSSRMGRGGEFRRLQNRVVLDAHLHGAPKAAAAS